MKTLAPARRAKPLVRSTVVLLALTGAFYVAGLLTDSATAMREGSPAFASPVQAAESPARAMPEASAIFTPADIGPTKPDVERIENPRECDAVHGVTIACVFMD